MVWYRSQCLINGLFIAAAFAVLCACSAPTSFSEEASSQAPESATPGEVAPIAQSPIDFKNLALHHSPNHRAFQIEFDGVSGVTHCELVLILGNSTIATIPLSDCASARILRSLELPATLPVQWHDLELWIRASAPTRATAFPSTLSCVPQNGSLTPTPSVDEDCDGNWDNTRTSGPANVGCNTALDASHFAPGGSYSLPATSSCGGSTHPFVTLILTVPNNSVTAYSDASCTTVLNYPMGSSAHRSAVTGVVPNSVDGGSYRVDTTTCQVFASPVFTSAGTMRSVRVHNLGWIEARVIYRTDSLFYY